MKERQPKKVYWGTVNDHGGLWWWDTRERAEHEARAELTLDCEYVHVVRLVPEVVKTVRRKP
jgi:hypothetical protein